MAQAEISARRQKLHGAKFSHDVEKIPSFYFTEMQRKVNHYAEIKAFFFKKFQFETLGGNVALIARILQDARRARKCHDASARFWMRILVFQHCLKKNLVPDVHSIEAADCDRRST